MKPETRLTRREFLRLSALGAAGTAFLPLAGRLRQSQGFPQADRLGRICAGGEGARFDLKAKPAFDAANSGTILRDEVVPWLREVSATNLDYNRINQSWVETPKGYIYAPYVQPVQNLPNQALETLPSFGAEKGAWVEVTVPYVDFRVDGGKPASPWLKETLFPRLYYSQIMWADDTRKDDSGAVWYRVRERYGSYGDMFWAPGEAFRVLTPDDMTPIHPEAEEKKVVVRIAYQTLSCYEGGREVYFCRVSTGYDGATPLGNIPTWRKMVSTHMSGNTTGAGYDTPGIGWTCLFSNDGAAIHSTFWHNDFGVARSHGCVNTLPEDARWIFRWTSPAVQYEPGDLIISGMNASTRIQVVES